MLFWNLILNTKRLITPTICIIIFLGVLVIGLSIKSKFNKEKQSTVLVKSKNVHANSNLVAVDGTNRDLGIVKEGTNPHVFFTLANIGTDETSVRVHDLSKGGCTSVSSIPKLAPGDTAQLELIFQTLGYGGRTPTRRVQIHYGNPEFSPLELSVTAKIIPPEPYQVLIGELRYNFFVLIDIRSPEAFAREHIVGAINVPQKELTGLVTNLPKYLLIYLYSEDGTKSDEAALMLRAKGFSECLSIVGGLNEWKQRYGKSHLISGPR